MVEERGSGPGLDFRLPGEHLYDGMRLAGHLSGHNLDAVKAFEFRDDDILVDSYPKSGTTWLGEMIYLILNDANTIKAKQDSIHKRFPYMEGVINQDDVMRHIYQSSPPRLLKSHLPFHFFSKPMTVKKMKAVYVARNPKDMLVSMYHFYCLNSRLGNFPGDWDSFFELFRAERIIYGDWFNHVNAWWQQRHLPNVFFIKYEDMHRDLLKCVRELAAFFEIHLTVDQLNVIVNHCSFSEMKCNKAVNFTDLPQLDESIGQFMRKGEVGDWLGYFTAEQNIFIETKYNAKLKEVGLHFDYTN